MGKSTLTRKTKGRCIMELPKIWSDALVEFTANHIPIRLINLSDLSFASRSDVAEHYRPILAAYIKKHKLQRLSPSRWEVTRTLTKVVKYAIFSHRWLAKGEPTFENMHDVGKFAKLLVRGDEAALSRALDANIYDTNIRAGLRKLLLFYSKARSYNCPFAWADTCCIDRRSSAELDESVRSMFRWYRNAYICIVHLASSRKVENIPDDEWFTRGWTLQELLAPRRIKFYNQQWRPFSEAKNDKVKWNDEVPEDESDPVWQAVLTATSIPPRDLSDFRPGVSEVAQRLSWAASRHTTRIEDMAYALMGIFGIHIPVQYGEGHFAFRRLMEALLQHVRGCDIFAWTGRASRYSAALPASIEGYLAVKRAEGFVSAGDVFDAPAVTLTHKGLQLEVLLVQMRLEDMPMVDEGAYTSRTMRKANTNSHAGESSDEETGSEEYSDQDEQNDDDSPYFVTTIGQYDKRPTRCLRFIDPDDTLEPVTVPDCNLAADSCIGIVTKARFFLAILNYRREWEGLASLSHPEHLAFVVYEGAVKGTWQKLETDSLVFVKVKEGKWYKKPITSILL